MIKITARNDRSGLKVCTALLILLIFAQKNLAQPNWGMPRVANTQIPIEEKTQRINNTPKAIVAPRPPMGWNSWNNFGLQITEAEFKKQVDYVAEKLKPYGYEYVVIDASWYSPSVSADKKSAYHHGSYAKHDAELDSFGRFLPANNKFPGARGSFKYLADYVHAKGLKFGLHIQRGIPWQAVEKDMPIMGSTSRARDIANPADVCLWFNATYGIDMTRAGAQEYYDSIFHLYTSWGVDFVKVDDLSMPYHADEITAVRKAIEKTGRAMVFSASPGSTPLSARYHVMQNTDMFRVSSDFWDTWEQLQKQFDFAKQWAVHSVEFPGRWPDLDMLPLGKIGTRSGDAGGERLTRFTTDEQYSLMTLWCISRSPLMVSNDLIQNNAFTLQLLTNKDVLEVNQFGTAQKQIFSENGLVVWLSKGKQVNSYYLALFNHKDQSQLAKFTLEQAGLNGRYGLRDLWKGTDRGQTSEEISADIPAHGVVLYKLTQLSNK
ncbi:glycoside hydrolase family 27 protein [Arcticibacter sp.]|uniref:glycoside hydrolase family 27 protein n=1 Tax=Arcticibacter sp. TaxID=1872630 RepID=UPI00388F0469